MLELGVKIGRVGLLEAGVLLLNYHMWRSRVEIEHYSVA